MAPPTVPVPQDDDYDSAADSDFGGSLSPSSGDDSSASDREGAKAAKKGKSRKKRSIEDSGDEGVVKEGKKKRRKKGKADHDAEEGTEESAIGMRVRDRKLGRAADQERKPLATSEGATADIDALWARLNSAPPPPPKARSPPPSATDAKDHGRTTSKDNQQPAKTPSNLPNNKSTQQTKPTGSPHHPSSEEEQISIKRTYQFAGETITESKTVPKSSAEARLYLQSQQQSHQQQQTNPSSSPAAAGHKPLRRPKKRPSMFEPNPEGVVKGLVPPTPIPTIKTPTSTTITKSTPTPNNNPGPKLNTVEKSKLDWASHVDQEGLKDELDTAEKARGGYMGRMEFLGRTEAKREDGLREARRG
ncbi:MAG: hypothetical protein Q9216_007226 [Gyalolechia sp. 2 TL-2023]